MHSKAFYNLALLIDEYNAKTTVKTDTRQSRWNVTVIHHLSSVQRRVTALMGAGVVIRVGRHGRLLTYR